MNLYRSRSRVHFLNELRSYLSCHCIDYEYVKVILPCGFLCNTFQHDLLTEKAALILPRVITFKELITESDDFFKIPHSSLLTLTPLEEKVLLAEIIAGYEKFKYSTILSMRFANKLSSLFYTIEANGIDIEKIGAIPFFDEARHWENIYTFLVSAYYSWKSQIAARGKLTRAEYQKKTLNKELALLVQEPNTHLVVAGCVPSSNIEQDFFAGLTAIARGHIILPPYSDVVLQKMASDQNLKIDKSPLYQIHQFLKRIQSNTETICHATTSIPYAPYKNHDLHLVTDSFTYLFGNTNNQQKEKTQFEPIRYLHFRTAYEEAEYVAKECATIMQEHPQARIAIVLTRIKNAAIYKLPFEKYNLQIADLIGTNILENNTICLLIEIADLICNPFSIKSFFKLLSNPEIACMETIVIKNILLKHARFAANLEEIKAALNTIVTSDLTLENKRKVNVWFDDKICLFRSIQPADKRVNFQSVLGTIIERAEKMTPQIWSRHEKLQVSDAVRELHGIQWSASSLEMQHFPQLLRACLEGGHLYKQNHKESIFIGKLSELSLTNADYTFILDCNEGQLPVAIHENPWLNKRIEEEVGMASYLRNTSIYHFFLIINANKICITRSEKQPNGDIMQESSILLHVKHNDTRILEYSVKALSEHKDISLLHHDPKYGYACPGFFPKTISATDIEMLVRAPYNFYAKKILKLQPIKMLDEYPTLAEFGNFFHEVAKQYTQNYSSSFGQETKRKMFISIVDELIANFKIPLYTKRDWTIRLKAISSEFINFEDARQTQSVKTLTEIRGQMAMEFPTKTINITAIADRIEIDQDNRVTILDYKTGAPPSKAELFSGQSPQLILEALIMEDGGFDNVKRKVKSLSFVKIASSVPYIRVSNYDIDQDELEKQRQELYTLINRYLTEGQYRIETCNAKYDDYHHLARR